MNILFSNVSTLTFLFISDYSIDFSSLPLQDSSPFGGSACAVSCVPATRYVSAVESGERGGYVIKEISYLNYTTVVLEETYYTVFESVGFSSFSDFSFLMIGSLIRKLDIYRKTPRGLYF